MFVYQSYLSCLCICHHVDVFVVTLGIGNNLRVGVCFQYFFMTPCPVSVFAILFLYQSYQCCQCICIYLCASFISILLVYLFLYLCITQPVLFVYFVILFLHQSPCTVACICHFVCALVILSSWCVCSSVTLCCRCICHYVFTSVTLS